MTAGRSIWFFEFKGWLASLSAGVQFGYASEDYSRRPADTGLALGFYAARLEKPGDFRQVMFSDGRTGGRSQVRRGEIVLVRQGGRAVGKGVGHKVRTMWVTDR